MKVTFDSNVWQIVACPDNFPAEPSIAEFKKIHALIKDGKITPFLSDVIFNLEAIKKNDRKDFFKTAKGKITIEETESTDNTISLNITISPSNLHPGNNEYLELYLEKAIDLGFRLVSTQRIGGVVNNDVPKKYFFAETEAEFAERYEKQCKVLRYIESKLNAGIFQIKQIGNKYSNNFETWMDGLSNAPDIERKKIIKAVSEWADGDAISAHISLSNDFFCTRDMGRSAGSSSVLSEVNREILNKEYGILFIKPEELAVMFS